MVKSSLDPGSIRSQLFLMLVEKKNDNEQIGHGKKEKQNVVTTNSIKKTNTRRKN